jgi:hypothetical protein
VPELLQPEANVTIVKNPGDPNMQIIIKDMSQIQVLNITDKIAGGQVVYFPENATAVPCARCDELASARVMRQF